MPMTMTEDLATLEGVCAVEEAEPLLDWLRRTEAPRLDLAGCAHLHTAILQTLLALRPEIVAAPPHPLLARVLGLADAGITPL